MMVPDYTIRSYRCDELGVCQSLHTLCSTCPQRMTLRPAPPLPLPPRYAWGFTPVCWRPRGPTAAAAACAAPCTRCGLT